MKKSFDNWKTNAIHLRFPNGNALSTTWDVGTYSDNYDAEWEYPRPSLPSNTCEVMILDCPEKLLRRIHKKFDGDGLVIGRVNMAEWLEIIKMLSK